jgi:hypothetical protein
LWSTLAPHLAPRQLRQISPGPRPPAPGRAGRIEPIMALGRIRGRTYAASSPASWTATSGTSGEELLHGVPTAERATEILAAIEALRARHAREYAETAGSDW